MKKITLAAALLVVSANAFAGVPGWNPKLPQEPIETPCDAQDEVVIAPAGIPGFGPQPELPACETPVELPTCDDVVAAEEGTVTTLGFPGFGRDIGGEEGEVLPCAN